MHTRRRFLYLLGGGVVAACGGSDGEPTNHATSGTDGGVPIGTSDAGVPVSDSGKTLPAPNGYRFLSAVSVGDALTDGRTVQDLVAQYVWLGQAPGSAAAESLMFEAVDDQGRTGLYEFHVKRGNDGITILDRRKIVREGETMTAKDDPTPGGRVVTGHATWDANNDGSTLVVIDTEGKTPAIYLDFERTGFRHILSGAQNGLPTLFGERLGCIALAANHDLFLVASFRATPEDTRSRMGVFFLPGGDVMKSERVVMAGDPAPGGGTLASFGLVELGANSIYAIQAGVLDDQGNITTRTFTGTLGDPLSLRILNADSETYFHPRIADASGVLGYVVHIDDATTKLRLGPNTILSTGDTSPSGNEIGTIHPPVFLQQDMLLALVETTAGTELVHHDGGGFKTVLASGDGIDGKEVQQFFFGTYPRQADQSGTFAALIDFGAQGQSIMVATPI